MLKAFLICSLFIVELLAHDCISSHAKTPPYYLNKTSSKGNKRDEPPEDIDHEQPYEPIRIYADFTYLPSDDVSEYIQNQLVPSGISYFQATLKVQRLQENLIVEPECEYLPTPQYLLEEGVAADLVVLIAADYYYDEDWIGGAATCGLNPSDNRPAYGLIIFNLNYFYTTSPADDEANLFEILHELTHVLGFSDLLYPYFINPITKAPLTNIVREKTVNGVPIQILDLEPLTSRLRAYFGCDTLEGAYLENEGGEGSALTHFERRVFMNEFMTASSLPDLRVSEFTLAVLEGTGWYKVNYNMADPFTWGQGRGCSFLEEPCVDENAVPNFPEFCRPLLRAGCSYTRTAAAYCGEIRGRLFTNDFLLHQWNYWNNYTAVWDSYSDNCPYYIGFRERNCENSTDQVNAILQEETYELTSKCFTGTLSHSSPSSYNAYCFESRCKRLKDGSPAVIVSIGSQTVTCKKSGPTSVPGFTGFLDCPDPQVFCTVANDVYCRRGCSGRGQCVDNVCKCPDGWQGRDCAQRGFTDNCARCANETIDKSCYGDLCRYNPNTEISDYSTSPTKLSVEGQRPRAKRDETKSVSRHVTIKEAVEVLLRNRSD